MVTIRRAEIADCPAMSAVRIASITALCGPDHGNDPAVIAAWVGNKSAEGFERLLKQPGVILLVAELEGAVVAVGGIAGDRVTLNYVDPAHRFAGISKALMVALEAELGQSGVHVARLESTATAMAFYRALGWIEVGPGTPDGGHPMEKRL